jgi:ribosomal protein S12 methylthiotransferase accessory factor YcaO
LTTEWLQVPDDITSADDERDYGDLQGTYEYIENAVLNHIQNFNIVFDLTLGPTLLTLAMARIAHEYSARAFRVSRYDISDSEVNYY